MSSRDDVHILHLLLFLVGGLCAGTGIVMLYYSFGWPHGMLNSDFREIGFSGLDNIHLLQPWADWAIPLVVIGVVALVIANATAWKETDGY